MKKMHGLVNLVPLIAKADSLTPKELRKLKDKVNKYNMLAVKC